MNLLFSAYVPLTKALLFGESETINLKKKLNGSVSIPGIGHNVQKHYLGL